MTAPVLRANSTLVAIAWLGGVAGLTPSMVAAKLPTSNESWAASGFVTVRPAGGRAAVDYPLRMPVVTCDFWACTVNSAKPPVGKANHLAETVYAATNPTSSAARAAIQRTVTLPGGYPDARVLGANAVGEIRPAYGDQGGYGHFLLDVQFDWVELP